MESVFSHNQSMAFKNRSRLAPETMSEKSFSMKRFDPKATICAPVVSFFPAAASTKGPASSSSSFSRLVIPARSVFRYASVELFSRDETVISSAVSAIANACVSGKMTL